MARGFGVIGGGTGLDIIVSMSKATIGIPRWRHCTMDN